MKIKRIIICPDTLNYSDAKSVENFENALKALLKKHKQSENIDIRWEN